MNSVVAAGTETTARTLEVITYHLCENPDMLEKLRAELKCVDLGSQNSRKLPPLEQLPYLYGVISEGLRLSYGVVSRLARIAPDRVIEYGKWKIPPGTPVGMSSGLIHSDPNAFPQPRAFDPERWVDPAKRRRLDKYMMSFSKGTRGCLGLKSVLLPPLSLDHFKCLIQQLSANLSPSAWYLVSPGPNCISRSPSSSRGSTSPSTTPRLMTSPSRAINGSREPRATMAFV